MLNSLFEKILIQPIGLGLLCLCHTIRLVYTYTLELGNNDNSRSFLKCRYSKGCHYSRDGE